MQVESPTEKFLFFLHLRITDSGRLRITDSDTCEDEEESCGKDDGNDANDGSA